MTSVAFCREIHPGDRGGDVIAHKRAISRWNPHAYPWPKDGDFTDFAGKFFWTALYEFKRTHGLLSAVEKKHRAANVLGRRTHHALELAHRHGTVAQPAFDARAQRLAHDFCVGYGRSPEQVARDKGVSALLFWYAHRAQTAYGQVRPFLLADPPTVSRVWDCSATATNGHGAGGFPDPNGFNYAGRPYCNGYTGTLIGRGVRVQSISQLQPLDLIFYGYSSGGPGFNRGDPTHVATFVGVINGRLSVVSMGHYPMSLYPYNYRGLNQMRHYSYPSGAADAFLAQLPTEEENT